MVKFLNKDEIVGENPSVNAQELSTGHDLLVEIRSTRIRKTAQYKLVPPTERHRVRVDEESCRDAHTVHLKSHA